MVRYLNFLHAWDVFAIIIKLYCLFLLNVTENYVSIPSLLNIQFGYTIRPKQSCLQQLTPPIDPRGIF